MTSRIRLIEQAERFLICTDGTYQECADGIANLDRIIVGSPSALSSIARSSLLPSLYAYWERFFRTVMADFLRCISEAKIPAEACCIPLFKFRLKGEVADRFKRMHINEIVESKPREETKLLFHELRDFFDAALAFQLPEEWIECESNVKYKVVEKNFEKIGLDISKLQDLLSVPLKPSLDKFVDTRNDIAHGSSIQPIDQQVWEKHRTFALDLMTALQLLLHEALESGAILHVSETIVSDESSGPKILVQ